MLLRQIIVGILLLTIVNLASGSWFSSFFGYEELDESVTNKKKEIPSPAIKIVKAARPLASVRYANATTNPTRHSFDNYLLKKINDNVERLGSITEILFLGDSLFYKFSKNKTRWSELEKNYAAINLGSPADRTEHILHRFRNGNVLSNITSASPLVITMVGASNAHVSDTPTSIIDGITATILLLNTYLKEPKIVVMSLLPRSAKPAAGILMDTNVLLEARYSANKEKNVEYLDIAKIFSAENNTIKFSLYGADKMSPNIAGQEAIFLALEPYLSKLSVLKNVPIPLIGQGPKAPMNLTRVSPPPVKMQTISIKDKVKEPAEPTLVAKVPNLV